MKKNLFIAFMCALMVFIAVSCEEPHTHSFSSEWKSDANSHWHECTCGAKDGEAAHSYEVVNDGEKLVKKCTVCGYVSSDEVTGTLVSTADALKTALSGDATAIYLGADITIDAAIEFKKSLIIDLNGKTLNFAVTTSSKDSGAFELKKATNAYTTVTIKNGNIKGTMTGSNTNTFTIYENAGLFLDNVTMDVTCNRGIQILYYECSATINIKSSNLKVNNGWYVVATNASVSNGKYSNGNTINIEKSTLEVTNTKDDCTGLLLNVPGTYTIKDSSIKGGRQAAILRGGDYTISNSTFEYTANNDENKLKETTNWESGNAVPNAAIVIGNRTASAYEYPTKVTFEGTNTLTVPTSTEELTSYHLYVYQADAIEEKDRTVKVTGDINPEWTVNSNMNGALYPSAKIGNTLYTFEDAVTKAPAGSTITLFRDLDLTEYKKESDSKTNNLFNFNDNVTVDLSGHTITQNNFGIVWSGKDLHIKNGTMSASNNGSYALFIWPNGSDEENKKTTVSKTAYLTNVKCTAGINVSAHNLVIDKDCIIDGDGTQYRALWAQSSAQVTINGGEFIGGKDNILGVDSTSTITVKGGTFKKGSNTVTTSLCYVGTVTDKKGSIIITGGTFELDPSTYVDTNSYKVEKNTTANTWTVSVK